jgi:hypothetical protein
MLGFAVLLHRGTQCIQAVLADVVAMALLVFFALRERAALVTWPHCRTTYGDAGDVRLGDLDGVNALVGRGLEAMICDFAPLRYAVTSSKSSVKSSLPPSQFNQVAIPCGV